MVISQGLLDLGKMFENQSRETWRRLSYVRDSSKSRGVLGPVRYGEETITDLLMMRLYLGGFTVALFEQTSRPDESVWGTDFELWIGSDQTGWFRFAIQSKRIDLKDDRYPKFTQKNSIGKQVNLLQTYAEKNAAAPLYCLYNFTDDVDGSKHWHCCDTNRSCDVEELGSTVTPLWNVRRVIDNGPMKFQKVHCDCSALPLRCLVACPKVADSLKTMSEQNAPKPAFGESPLFDPASCYHETLPRILHRESGAVVRERENGGMLLSVPVDPDDKVILDQQGRISAEAREDFPKRYSREAGIPKAAVTISL